MKPKIIYNPLSQQTRMVRRVNFTPLSQRPKGIGGQILDYLKTGKPLSPIIKTEIIVPPQTKKFARGLVFTLVGGAIASVVLYQVLK